MEAAQAGLRLHMSKCHIVEITCIGSNVSVSDYQVCTNKTAFIALYQLLET